MSDYFGDIPAKDEGIFTTGDSYRRSSQDLFGGDFYADDEPVRRGLSLARAPAAFQNPLDDVAKEGYFAKQAVAPAALRRLVFPGCEGVDLEVRDVDTTGKSFYFSAGATELATAVLEYFSQHEGIAMPREQKRAIKAHLCVKYELLKIKVSLCVPKDAQCVAMTWERKAGDGVEFMSMARGCETYLSERGLRCQEQLPGALSPPFGAAIAPHLGLDFPMFGAPLAGEKTPNFRLEFPSLVVDPCTVEDLQPFLAMAAEPHGPAKAEAALELCRIADGEDDVAAVLEALQQQPLVLLDLLEEPACVLAAPALAEKLVAQGAQLDWAAVSQLLVARIPSEAALGQRQLSRALAVVAAHCPTPGLFADVSALRDRCEDVVARQRLAEAAFSTAQAA